MFTIPDNYDSIGRNAFNPLVNKSLANSNWENVHTIVVGNKAKSINGRAFERCKMRKIILSENLKFLWKKCFYHCDDLEEINIPKSVEFIGFFCFYSCSFKEINLPEGLKTLDDGCFYSCPIKSISIPKSVSYIGIASFDNCQALKSVEFEKGINLKQLPDYCFKRCNSLRHVALPSSVVSIGEDCFEPNVDIPAAFRK